MKNRAFTLIELLVVIGIIALLASIALPVFRSAQERASGVKDMNNLRQIGIGFVSYLNDHDDTMFSTTGLGGSTWGLQLSGSNATASNSYVPDMRTFQSPFDKRPAGIGPNGPFPLSYGINSYIMTPPVTGGNTITSTGSYTHPSSLIVLGPSNIYANNQVTFAGTTATNVTIKHGTGIVGVMGNRGLLNLLYCDWHVATVKETDFNAGTGGTTDTAWNPIAQ